MKYLLLRPPLRLWHLLRHVDKSAADRAVGDKESNLYFTFCILGPIAMLIAFLSVSPWWLLSLIPIEVVLWVSPIVFLALLDRYAVLGWRMREHLRDSGVRRNYTTLSWKVDADAWVYAPLPYSRKLAFLSAGIPHETMFSKEVRKMTNEDLAIMAYLNGSETIRA